MVIFIFLVRKYPFCVNLIRKFKRVISRQNLLPSLERLIELTPTKNVAFPPLSFCLLIIEKGFQPEFETIYLC